MRNPKRLQAAGNSGLCGDITFDSIVDIREHRTKKRLEGILSYLHNKNGVTKKEYLMDISKYLLANYNIEENDSNKMHWIKRPWWWSFVEFDASKYFKITPAGQQCLSILTSNSNNKKEDFLRLLLDQGTRVQYPNPATPKVATTVTTRPIVLIFYLFLKYEYLTYDELTCILPYITDASYLDANQELDFKNLGILGDRYVKLFTWDIADFIKLGVILPIKNNNAIYYKLNPIYVEYVKYYYGKYIALDVFLSGAGDMKNYLIDNSVSRDSQLPLKVKTRDNSIDVLTGSSAAWHSSTDGRPGCEMHHIIPIEKKNYYMNNYGVNVDSEEYCITVLCETHSRLHRALFKEKRHLITAMFNWLSDEAKVKINLTLDKLLELYK